MSKSKKHIVLITPGFPSNESDSNCIPALQIYCSALRKIEYLKITVISLHYPYTTVPYKWNYIEVYPLGFQNRFLIPFFSNKKVIRMIKSLHSNDPIDLIHSFWLGECTFAGHHFSKKYSIDHITTLMGQDAKKGNRYARLLPLKKMNIISVSEFQRSIFKKNYNIQTKVIPWGVDSNLIPSVSEKTIDIIGIGSLIPLKDYSEFIKIIHKLRNEFPQIKSVIAGDGVQRSNLKRAIKDLGLEKNIELMGKLSYSKTQELLGRSKILLHTSKYESFGMVFAEALANNTYIVSKDVGIAEESDHWSVCETQGEFIKECKIFLISTNASISKYPKIESTVNEYLKIYKRS